MSDIGERELFDALIALELELLDPAVRGDRVRVLQLLHEDFVEFGASGRRWDRPTMVLSLEEEHDARRAALIETSDFEVRMLAPKVALLTYTARGTTGRRTLRSSVWTAEHGSWQLLFHQGTFAT